MKTRKPAPKVPARHAPTPRGAKPTKAAIPRTASPLDRVRALVRDIPDFPKPGILFRDITPVLGDARAFHSINDAFVERFLDAGITHVAGIEARGFIFAAPLALRLNAAFVPLRKPGKLPYRAERVRYDLEYGSAELEAHTDAFRARSRVLIVDDVLATGGTARAAMQLVHALGASVVGAAFVIELAPLGGRQHLGKTEIFSLLTYGG